MKNNIKTLAGVSLMLALVIVLQLLGSFIKFGPFSISLVLVPIVITSGLYGPSAGALAGLVFGLTVILSGDAAAFLAISIPGTFVICLGKGVLAGLVAGYVFKIFGNKTKIATLAAAISAPVTNTLVFLVGCYCFFLETMKAWAEGFGFGDAVVNYMIFGLVGGNFIVELIINVVLSYTIYRLINYRTK